MATFKFTSIPDFTDLKSFRLSVLGDMDFYGDAYSYIDPVTGEQIDPEDPSATIQYDTGLETDSDLSVLTAGSLKVADAPATSTDVVRLSDLTGAIGKAAVANVADPSSELASLSADAVGGLLIAYQVGANANDYTIYSWDTAVGTGASIPYIVAGDGGFWVAVGGKYVNGDVGVSGTLTAGGITGFVATTRTINTTAPLAGGGDLSADRTLSIVQASGAADGYLSSGDWTTFNNKVATTRSISTTTPLAGGGDLSADRTLTVGGLSSMGAANQIVGANAAAGAWEYKTLSGTANRVTVTHGAGTITLSGPQDLATTSSPTFAQLNVDNLRVDANTIYAISGTNAFFGWDADHSVGIDDTGIYSKVDAAYRTVLTASVLYPFTSAGVALGSSSKVWSALYVDNLLLNGNTITTNAGGAFTVNLGGTATFGDVDAANAARMTLASASGDLWIDGDLTLDAGEYVKLGGASNYIRENSSVTVIAAPTTVQIADATIFELISTAGLYFGANATDGTWRIIRSGNDLVFERRESGSYVTKATVSSAGGVS